MHLVSQWRLTGGSRKYVSTPTESAPFPRRPDLPCGAATRHDPARYLVRFGHWISDSTLLLLAKPSFYFPPLPVALRRTSIGIGIPFGMSESSAAHSRACTNCARDKCKCTFSNHGGTCERYARWPVAPSSGMA